MSQNHDLLLAEDDTNLGNLLKEYLELKGFNVELARHGKEAIDKAMVKTYDLLILDVMMPRVDGFTVANELRRHKQTPIIFLTAKGEKEDKVKGFESGADDYLTKPFSMEELLLRINAVLRRSTPQPQSKQDSKLYVIGKITFDYDLQCLRFDGKEMKISTKEAELLHLLCSYKNEVMPRQEALLKIWGDDDYFNARSMDVYITKLRKYLKADPALQIMNVHGKGYKLVVVE